MTGKIGIKEYTNANCPIDYSECMVPNFYKCSFCGSRGKMYRLREQNNASTQLYCLACKNETSGIDLVMAIPHRHGTSYILDGEAPRKAKKWWASLGSKSRNRRIRKVT